MLFALIAAIAAVLAVIAIIVIVFFFYKRSSLRKSKTAHPQVKTLDTVGVESSVGKRGGVEQRVGSGETKSGKPAESLESRFKVMGGFAAIVFGALSIKAFIMQVFNARTYSKESEENQYTTVYTPAPRGTIYDCKGREIVRNRSSLTVLAEADVASDHDVVCRLSAVLGIPQGVVQQRIEDESTAAQEKRVVASDVDLNKVAFISEHADAFPGVTVETRTVRDYPYDALAAHAIGYPGTVSEEELKQVAEGQTIKSGDEVGKSGIEATYNSVLAGTHGERKVVTDADSNIIEVVSETAPTKGDDVYLTIDATVQYAADAAMAELIAPNGAIGSGDGTGGALIAMDVRDGSILALSNYPTFSPKEFVGGISTHVWEVYNSDLAHNPMLNRVIAGTYPAASTYKAFTGLAGLIYKYADVKGEHIWDCEGAWDGFQSGDVQMCWNHGGHGELDLRGGIINSCDVVFYEIAKDFFDNRGSIGEAAMQDVIKRYNFGELCGIDIEGEAYGRVPTPAWKKEYFKDVPEEASWKGGDSTNMSIGQGYVLVTPIQLACGYAGIATGKIPRPHLLKEVKNAGGGTSISYKTGTICEPEMEKEYLAFMREALHGVATDNSAVAVCFSECGVEVAAKTGTGEVAGKSDYSLGACYAPYDDPRYVVACVIEEGGGGSDTAMPLCGTVMKALLDAEAGAEGEIGVVAGSTGKVIEGAGGKSSSRTD